MPGCATFLPASRRAHQRERRLGRGKIGSKIFELERETTCTWTAPGSGYAAGSTSPLRPPRLCPGRALHGSAHVVGRGRGRGPARPPRVGRNDCQE